MTEVDTKYQHTAHLHAAHEMTDLLRIAHMFYASAAPHGEWGNPTALDPLAAER